MDQFFASINQPTPQTTDVSVDGTQNQPSPDPQGADYEVALDIQVAAQFIRHRRQRSWIAAHDRRSEREHAVKDTEEDPHTQVTALLLETYR